MECLLLRQQVEYGLCGHAFLPLGRNSTVPGLIDGNDTLFYILSYGIFIICVCRRGSGGEVMGRTAVGRGVHSDSYHKTNGSTKG